MPTTALDVQTISTLNPTAFDELVWVAADVANGNHYAATGREILLIRNVSEDTAYDVTVPGPANSSGRTTTLTDEIPFGEYAMGMFEIEGWRQPTNRRVLVTGENADIEFAVIRLPERFH